MIQEQVLQPNTIYVVAQAQRTTCKQKNKIKSAHTLDFRIMDGNVAGSLSHVAFKRQRRVSSLDHEKIKPIEMSAPAQNTESIKSSSPLKTPTEAKGELLQSNTDNKLDQSTETKPSVPNYLVDFFNMIDNEELLEEDGPAADPAVDQQAATKKQQHAGAISPVTKKRAVSIKGKKSTSIPPKEHTLMKKSSKRRMMK